MSRFVARLILPALEAPRPRTFGERLTSRRSAMQQDEESDTPDDPLTRAILPAVQDMQTLVGHVFALLDGPVAKEAGITQWLQRLQAELDLIRESAATGRMSSRLQITMEDEEASGLEEALSHGWDSEDNDWPDQPEFHLLAKLMGYWLKQVQDRGRSLLHLIIGADDMIGAAKSLTKLNEVSYPL